MAKKNSADKFGFVYSTDPNFNFQPNQEEEQETLLPNQQKLRVKLDTKQRGGKAVTLIEGFKGLSSDLEELGKKIKQFCGTGGAVKDTEIIIQGDQRQKVIQWLLKKNYTQTKQSGG